ncbi:hypothetical protein VTN96DRAFT_4714 [Rasamsonia emersonii]
MAMALQAWSLLRSLLPNSSLAAVLLATILILTYTVTSIKGHLTARLKPEHRRSPPTLPYAIPFLRHLPQWLIDEKGFLSRAMTCYSAYTPVRVHLGNRSFFVLSGPKTISSLFKNSKRLVSTQWLVGILIVVFGLPPADAPLYLNDDTGYGVQPVEGAKMTNPDLRIFYLAHRSLYAYIAGPGLDAMARQLVCSLAEQIAQCPLADDDCWTDVPDLYAGLIRKMTFKASVTALCGAHIFTINPDLDEDFWAFDAATLSLMRWPSWLVPGARRAREKMKLNMTRWHRFAEQHYHYDGDGDDPRDWEEFFGNRIMRMRNRIYRKLPLSDEAYAAEDVGMLWAANANAIPAVIWMLLEIVQRPELLARVRAEIAPYITHDAADASKISSVDIAGLCSIPLLQSIYAEVLRLQVGIVLPWMAADELRIEGWSVQEGETVMASTWHAGRDPLVWNTGSVDDPHPVDEFWAERFLVKNDGVHMGPVRKAEEEATPSCPHKQPFSSSASDKSAAAAQQCSFTLAGTAGTWIPYGGGLKLCPGRHFAKQEMIVASAMFLTAFDIELTTNKRIVPDERFFMFGVLPPRGRIGRQMSERGRD